MSLDIKTLMKNVKPSVNQELARLYPENKKPTGYESTDQAIRYMILNDNSKRIRPTLVAAANILVGGNLKNYMPSAIAVEEIHTYSLILDDIQDKSDMRHGQASCHKQFDEHTANLAAVRLLARGSRRLPISSDIRSHETMDELIDQMHRGQAADLNMPGWTDEKKTLEALAFIHAGKTSCLFQLSLLAGAVSGGASYEQAQPLLEYGHYLGLVFQGQDDILSATLTTEELGKPAGATADEGKLTIIKQFNGNVDMARKEIDSMAKLGLSFVQNFKQAKLLIGVMDMALKHKK